MSWTPHYLLSKNGLYKRGKQANLITCVPRYLGRCLYKLRLAHIYIYFIILRKKRKKKEEKKEGEKHIEKSCKAITVTIINHEASTLDITNYKATTVEIINCKASTAVKSSSGATTSVTINCISSEYTRKI